MRLLGSWILFSATLGTLGIAPAQNSNPPQTQPVITLNISAVQKSIKAGSSVQIRVNLKNISSHDIALVMEVKGRDCRVDVRDADGKLAPETKLGYVWNGHVASPDPSRVSPQDLTGNLVYGTLKAGETQSWQMDVSKLYELKQPGRYTIQVERKDPENPSITVKSNTITVTVTP